MAGKTQLSHYVPGGESLDSFPCNVVCNVVSEIGKKIEFEVETERQ